MSESLINVSPFYFFKTSSFDFLATRLVQTSGRTDCNQCEINVQGKDWVWWICATQITNLWYEGISTDLMKFDVKLSQIF